MPTGIKREGEEIYEKNDKQKNLVGSIAVRRACAVVCFLCYFVA